MRVKFYFLALSFCCVLPFMALGADLDEKNPPDPPRSPLRPMPSVIVETESGMLNLYFTSDLGEVHVLLQPVAGKADYFQSVDTSIQNQAVLAAPAGTYVLTITDIAENIIKLESVVIP